MSTAKVFFDHELTRLDAEIAGYEKRVSDYAANDPHGNGQRALLRAAQQFRALAAEVAGFAADGEQALVQVHLRQIKAAREHASIGRNGVSDHTAYADTWWDTLGRLQYLADLANRLSGWLHAHADSSTPPR